MSDLFRSRPASLNGNADILIEVAGFMQAGRLDSELATQARAPRAPREVGDAVVRITRFAIDQYEDAVAYLSALGTKVHNVADSHVALARRAEFELYRLSSDRLLLEGRIRRPSER